MNSLLPGSLRVQEQAATCNLQRVPWRLAKGYVTTVDGQNNQSANRCGAYPPPPPRTPQCQCYTQALLMSSGFDFIRPPIPIQPGNNIEIGAGEGARYNCKGLIHSSTYSRALIMGTPVNLKVPVEKGSPPKNVGQ